VAATADIARDLENLGAMPAGLIEEDDRMRARSDLDASMNPFQFWIQFAEQWQKA
jgi:hypothetical protein